MNILITGASKGIGKALALKFCTIKDSSLFLISRDRIRLEEVKSSCYEINPSCNIKIYQADLGIPENIKPIAKQIGLDAVKIDILVNNAGSLVNKKFADISDDEARYMFDVNFFAAASVIQNLMPLIMKAENAQIVNIGSMGGFQGSSKYPGLAYYSASKAALAVLTECLAEEYKNSGITFNCLALGAVQTEMFTEAFPGVVSDVKPSEMAEYIFKFTTTSENRLNGKIIPVILKSVV